jgi:PAS domain S-box-containing protein
MTRIKLPAWHSLRLRLPLIMSAFIAAVLTLFLWVASREVESALLNAGGARAQGAADQLATLLMQSAQQRVTDIQRAARSSAVLAYLQHPSDATAADARQRLMSLTVANQPAVELWDDNGTRLLVVSGPHVAGRAAPVQVPVAGPPSRPGLSAFQLSGNAVFWDAVADVHAEPAAQPPSAPASKRLGYVVSRRLLSASTSDVIGRLVGSGAVVQIGNRTGDVWTDLSKVVAAPPVDVKQSGVAEYRAADGHRRLGASALIRGTPWAVWVEFPRSGVVAPARTFLARMMIFGLGFVVAAAVLARTISARITTPLHDLTHAAEAIAAGTPLVHVDSKRRDEIGRLGAAFDTMAEQVQSVQRELQQRVEKRVAELQETRQELDGFFALSLDMLCIAGTDGYFKRLNPAWSATLGWTDEELRSKPYLEFVHPDDREATRRTDAHLAHGSNVVHFENRYACRDGSYRWLEWKSVHVPGRDFVYASARDITEQKAADSRIRALNDQLEQRVSELHALSQELEAFSYSVSHDLRAPLRHVTGFAAILDKSAGPALDEKSRRYVRTISEAATRMGRLIDDLLVFSRMGRTEMMLGRVDLAALVADVRRELAAGENSVNVGNGVNGRRVAWNVHPLPVVRADAATLRLVLVNLMSNALKYSATRPIAEIEIGCNGTPEETIVFVRDNGVGFDMQYAHKLFGVFQRLHSSDEFEGTGIGLANVRRIVHRHGGRVWAEGAAGRGATFFFSLPRTGETS